MTSEAELKEIDLGYQHVESHFVYIHQSSTREIAVFEKVTI